MVEYQRGSAGAFDRLYSALSDEVYAYLAANDASQAHRVKTVAWTPPAFPEELR